MRTWLVAVCSILVLTPARAATTPLPIHASQQRIPVLSHSSLRASVWPDSDGVPVMAGLGGLLQRAANADLWVLAKAPCSPPDAGGFPGAAIVRGIVTPDGVVTQVNGSESPIYCAPICTGSLPGSQTARSPAKSALTSAWFTFSPTRS